MTGAVSGFRSYAQIFDCFKSEKVMTVFLKKMLVSGQSYGRYGILRYNLMYFAFWARTQLCPGFGQNMTFLGFSEIRRVIVSRA